VVRKVNSLRNSGFRARLAFEAKTCCITFQAVASLFHYLSQFKVSDGPQDKCGEKVHERKQYSSNVTPANPMSV